MINIFKKYIENRKKLNSHTKKFYIKRFLFPFIIVLPLCLLGIYLAQKINHSQISTALVSCFFNDYFTYKRKY